MEDGPPGWACQEEEQLHLTLRYIGEVERPVAEDIALALASVHAPAIDLALSGVGWFDQGARGAVFARAAPTQPLAALHAKLDRALVRLGLEPERRAYLPHITLARRRAGAVDPADWLERTAGLASPPERTVSMILFESHLGRHGPAYEAIAAYPLTA
jgi:2'-5' RNA ligase